MRSVSTDEPLPGTSTVGTPVGTVEILRCPIEIRLTKRSMPIAACQARLEHVDGVYRLAAYEKEGGMHHCWPLHNHIRLSPVGSGEEKWEMHLKPVVLPKSSGGAEQERYDLLILTCDQVALSRFDVKMRQLKKQYPKPATTAASAPLVYINGTSFIDSSFSSSAITSPRRSSIAYAIGELRGETDTQVKMTLLAESYNSLLNLRTFSRTQCNRLDDLNTKDGERLLTYKCLKEGTLVRLLGAITWPALDSGAELEPAERPMLSLEADLVTHIISFLVVECVVPEHVQAIAASSIDLHSPLQCSIKNALDPSKETWWISGPNSMPKGVGSEWIAFALAGAQPQAGGSSSSSSGGGDSSIISIIPTSRPVRVARVDMRIPPMPSGPLSVRDFHLESALSAEGPWRHASATFSTLDRPEMQSWAIRPPIEATHLRVVCTRNAARARLDEAVLRLTRQDGTIAEDDRFTEEDRERALMRVSSSVGFFSVAFS